MSLKRIALFEQIFDPTPAADKCFIYAKDFEGRTEMFFMDQGGAVTQITKDGYLNVKYDADVLGLPRQESDPGYSAGKGALYSKTINGIVELFYIDSNGITTQITNAGQFNVSDKIMEGNTKAEVRDLGADGYFYITVEGAEKFRVTKDGYVGIGNNSPSSLLTLGKAGTVAGVLSLAGATSGNVSVDVASVAGTWVMTLPTSGGSIGQYLKTDGSGNCSWSTVSVSPGGSDHQIQFNNSSSFDGCSNFYWDHVNSRVGIGCSNPDFDLEVRSDQYTGVGITSCSNSYASYLYFYRSRGSNSSKSAVQSGDILMSMDFRGFGTANWMQGAQLYAVAAGNFSDSSSPGDFYITTCASGSTVPKERLRITSTGIVQVGLATGATGKINFLGTTSGTVGLTVADAAGTWTMKLPDGAGSVGNSLITDGSGVTSWSFADKISEGNTSAEVIDTGSDGRFVITTEGSERLRVDNAGKLLVGCTSSSWNNEFAVSGGANYTAFTSTYSGAPATGIIIRSARGTIAAPTPTQSGDMLGAVYFGGCDANGTYANASLFRCYATQTWQSGKNGSDFRIDVTANDTSNNIEALRVTNDRNLLIGTTDNDGTPPTGRLVIKGADAAGTYNCLVLRDSNESNIFTFTTAGALSAVGTGVSYRSDTTCDFNFVVNSSAAAVYAPSFQFVRSRGSNASKTAVVNGDYIGAIYNWAYDGSSYLYGPQIVFKVDNTVSTGVVPGCISFLTSPNGSSTPVAERMVIGSNGGISTYGGNFYVYGGYVYAVNGFSGPSYYLSGVGYYYGRTTDGLHISPLAGSDYGKNNVIITTTPGYTHAKPISIDTTLWVQSANGYVQPAENTYISHNQTDGYMGTEKGNLWLNPYSGVVAIGSVAKRTGKITLSGSTSGTVTIQPKNAAGTWSLTLPDNDGDAGNSLVTDGGGITSWSFADKISEGNTKAEVRDTGSDGYFYVVTEGTERMRVDNAGTLTNYGSIVHSGSNTITIHSDTNYAYIDSAAAAWGLRVNGTTWAMYIGASQNIFYKYTTFDAGFNTTVTKPANVGGEITFMGSAENSNDPTTWTTFGEKEDTITISVGSGSSGVDSTHDLFPANSVIFGVTCRVIQAPGGGATNFDVQVKGGTAEGCIKDCLVALNTAGISIGAGTYAGVSTFPFTNASAAKATITTDGNVTVSDMKVRVNVSYMTLRPPTAV
jgi:hypothetical protein